MEKNGSTTASNQPTSEVIEIIADESGDINEQIASLETRVFEYFRRGHFHLKLNLRHVKVAPPRMIVFFVRATSQARRLGGDIELAHLNPFVRNNLVTFSPKTFLSIEQSEDFALLDLGEEIEPELISSPTEEPEPAERQQEPMESADVENNRSDEIALEILQSLDLRDSDKVRINSSADSLYKVCDFVVQRAGEAGFDEHELAKLKVTTYEASLNVVEHAYFSNPDYWIDVYAVHRDGKFCIVIHDWGTSFEFNPDKNYDVEMAVKQRRTGGFGLHIIRRSVDEIYYLKDQKIGNRLILIKKLPE